MQGGHLLNRKNMNLTASTYNIEQDKINKNNSSIVIPDNCKTDLIKAMKIRRVREREHRLRRNARGVQRGTQRRGEVVGAIRRACRL